MDFEQQDQFFHYSKTNFKALFKKDAEDDLNLFFNYLNAVSNKELIWELQELNANLLKNKNRDED